MKIEKALANIQLLGTQVKKIEFENDFIVFYEQDDTKKYLPIPQSEIDKSDGHLVQNPHF